MNYDRALRRRAARAVGITAALWNPRVAARPDDAPSARTEGKAWGNCF